MDASPIDRLQFAFTNQPVKRCIHIAPSSGATPRDVPEKAMAT